MQLPSFDNQWWVCHAALHDRLIALAMDCVPSAAPAQGTTTDRL